ncbi:MAG: hypothetical protein MR274_00095 [Clostridium sp.]|nr:hypothetical protein [Clostridium sp.]MDY3828463.1 hypothetical protein [Clostridium sp.]
MAKERILEKKVLELNQLKMRLMTRGDEVNRDRVVEEIKKVIDDLELILVDFDYISSDREVEKEKFRTYKSFKESQKI